MDHSSPTTDPEETPDRLPHYSAKQVREGGGQYFVDAQGKRLPNVTTILNRTKSAEQWQALANWRQRVGVAEANQITRTASSRGTGTHKQIQRFLQGDRTPCSASVQPYWNSIEPVLHELRSVRLVEGSVFHYDLGYAGKVDCVATYRGVPCICEWKTADKPKGSVERLYDHPLQMVAYCGAVNHLYRDNGVQLQHGLLVVAIGDAPAEIFWFEPEAIVHYWNQWQQRLALYQRLQNGLF